VEFSEARLGLEAQKKAVSDYLGGGAGDLSGEFLEIESGRRNDRPQLAAALQACRQHRATLVIAKLDRLARDAHFLLGLEKAGVDFVACDLPAANRLMLGILALVAEDEARAISARTKAALAAAKARGTVLGTPANLTNFQLGIRNSANVKDGGRATSRLWFAAFDRRLEESRHIERVSGPPRVIRAINTSATRRWLARDAGAEVIADLEPRSLSPDPIVSAPCFRLERDR
jgi:DNA invertase Pin-like site-specific DNA recombinase